MCVIQINPQRENHLAYSKNLDQGICLRLIWMFAHEYSKKKHSNNFFLVCHKR